MQLRVVILNTLCFEQKKRKRKLEKYAFLDKTGKIKRTQFLQTIPNVICLAKDRIVMGSMYTTSRFW